MFQLFASSPAPRAGRVRATTLSVAVHTGVILMVMSPSVAPPSAGHMSYRDRGPTERVSFIALNRPAHHTEKARPTSTTRRSAPTVPIALSAPVIGPITVPETPAAPNIDFSGATSDSADFARPATLAEVIGGVLGRRADPVNGIYSAESVEKVVSPFGNNPKPVYPPSLVSAGVEGDFVVEFVVDSTGLVDRTSLEFPKTAHGLFVDAVRRALERSRYRPAEINGRAVPQRVVQEFAFRLENGRRR